MMKKMNYSRGGLKEPRVQTMSSLRPNQLKAIDASLQNDFASGIHFAATGAGKSWIALQLAREFLKRNPAASNIFWICEQKSILIEQFDKATLQSRGFADIRREFLVFDFTVEKPADWVSRINSAQMWRKPMLIIINRAFLTSGEKYRGFRFPLHLIIHDECHSIGNATTQAFYTWALAAYPALRCIGFTATPTTDHAPFKQLLSEYSIYDAVEDDVIVPPHIVWLKNPNALRVGDAEIRDILCEHLLPAQPYKKLLVWCGMLELASELHRVWSADVRFSGWILATDTSQTSRGFEEFIAARGNAILFCASKHREGSDIPYLDTCVFMDRVEKRCARTFVQCMGRVLRKDAEGRKCAGLIVDVCAASSMKLCDRIHEYLGSTAAKQFPYRYTLEPCVRGLQVHHLHMVSAPATVPHEPTVFPTCADLTRQFKRPLPEDPRYGERLLHEMALIESKGLAPYLHRALEILELTRDVPHVTRGSCGSSLLCYMLGISHVDPVKSEIRFARFLNEFRTTLPDIDFDFPYNLRDEVFLQILGRWPAHVARISNHIFYRRKSAMREAIRRVGIRRRIPALEMTDTVRRLPLKQRTQVEAETQRLEETFRGYSLHCGGIVFYPDGIPADLLHRGAKGAMAQVTLNKHDVAKEGRFKIDILSSRALAQLYECAGWGPIHFEGQLNDAPTAALFARGDNVGITLAESPLIRKAFRKHRPSSVDDVAKCMAIIRPAADMYNEMFVYDDDAIDVISQLLGCSDAEGDRWRRVFAKGDAKGIRQFEVALAKARVGKAVQTKILPGLKKLREYGFCKAHAHSYAQLVWQLGYMKAHRPREFWTAALKHCDSSYRKWVHLYEAKCAGVCLESVVGQRRSIYAEERSETKAKTTVWPFGPGTAFYPNCWLRHSADDAGVKADIRGLIAAARVIVWDSEIKTVAVCVGTAPHEFVDVMLQGKYVNTTGYKGVTVEGAEWDDVAKNYMASAFTFW